MKKVIKRLGSWLYSCMPEGWRIRRWYKRGDEGRIGDYSKETHWSIDGFCSLCDKPNEYYYHNGFKPASVFMECRHCWCGESVLLNIRRLREVEHRKWCKPEGRRSPTLTDKLKPDLLMRMEFVAALHDVRMQMCKDRGYLEGLTGDQVLRNEGHNDKLTQMEIRLESVVSSIQTATTATYDLQDKIEELKESRQTVVYTNHERPIELEGG